LRGDAGIGETRAEEVGVGLAGGVDGEGLIGSVAGEDELAVVVTADVAGNNLTLSA
jgi:hypothetical protein